MRNKDEVVRGYKTWLEKCTGVGVKIKRNGLPVSLGKWLNDLAVPQEGNNSYRFSAAYYQIDKK